MIDTISTCCNAPITYQGNRLINDPVTGEFQTANIYTCDGCGNECELETEE